jgi:hypothetical protein
MLQLDLMRLQSPDRFQTLCSRLARKAFPDAMPVAFASWDGGRDIIRIMNFEGDTLVHDVVWQAKFTNRLDATTKRAIRESIATITERENVEVCRWILCIPVDPTGVFLEWLAKELPTKWKWEVWGATILLELLEENPDITEQFFYAAYEELRRQFSVEKLELVRFQLDPSCQWEQRDPEVLNFFIRGNVMSPDFVLDIIVRNVGRVDALLLALEVDFIDWESKMHGIPGQGLLFPQITYEISINHGRPDTYRSLCEPPLVVRAGGVERFKVRIRDTGYAWRGSIVLTLDYGSEKRLRLPALRLYA